MKHTILFPKVSDGQGGYYFDASSEEVKSSDDENHTSGTIRFQYHTGAWTNPDNVDHVPPPHKWQKQIPATQTNQLIGVEYIGTGGGTEVTYTITATVKKT